MNASDEDLRAMLRARAQDITTLPAELLPPTAARSEGSTEQTHTGVSRRSSTSRRPMLIAAAVAAVLAVSGGVAAIALSRDDEHGAGPASRPSITSVQSNPAPPSGTCQTTLPSSWNRLLTGSGATSSNSHDTPLATSPDGSVLYARDLGTTDPVNSWQVRLAEPDGSSATLASIPTALKVAPEFGAFSGKNAIIGLVYAPRGGNGTGHAVFFISSIDLSTDKLSVQQPVMSMSNYVNGTKTVEGLAVVNGQIYIDQRPKYDSSTGVVSSSNNVVYRGPAVSVHQSAGGVYWTKRNDSAQSVGSGITIAAKGLPRQVLQATTPISRTTLGTDGTRYAWLDSGRSSIGWFDGTTVHYRPIGAAASKVTPQNGLVVAGQYVSYYAPGADTSKLIDMTTGAEAPLPESVALTGGGGSYLTGLVSTNTVSGRLLQVNTSALPALRC